MAEREHHPKITPELLQRFRDFLRNPSADPPRLFAKACADREQDLFVAILSKETYRARLFALNDNQLATSIFRLRKSAEIPPSPYDKLRRQLREAIDKVLDDWPPRETKEPPPSILDTSGRISTALVAQALSYARREGIDASNRKIARSKFTDVLWSRHFAMQSVSSESLINSAQHSEAINTRSIDLGIDKGALSTALFANLPKNQQELLHEIAGGKQRPEIMQKLGCSSATYDRHFKGLVGSMKAFAESLQTSSRAELRAVIHEAVGHAHEQDELRSAYIGDYADIERQPPDASSDFERKDDAVRYVLAREVVSEAQLFELFVATLKLGSVM